MPHTPSPHDSIPTGLTSVCAPVENQLVRRVGVRSIAYHQPGDTSYGHVMDGVNVDPSEVFAAAQWIESSATDFTADVDQLLADVHALLGADWAGAAADTFTEGWRDWGNAAKIIVGALTDDAALLRTAAHRYTNTDDSTSGTLDGIGSGLNIQQ